MRVSLNRFAALVLALGLCAGLAAQTAVLAAEQTALETVTNLVADPNAVVTLGPARFTVLTPQLIGCHGQGGKAGGGDGQVSI